MATKTIKPHTEYYLVTTGNQAVRSSGNLFGTGTSVNLTNGQLGTIWGRSYGANAYGKYLTGGETIADAPVVKIVQGTSNSANFANLHGWHYDTPPFVSTPEIHANSITAVACVVPGIGTYSSQAIQLSTTPSSSTRYALNVKLRSVRKDRDFGGNVDQTTIDYTTGDLTSVSNKAGKVLMGWANKMNASSKWFNVSDILPNNRQWAAFAIDVAGSGSGTTIGTLQVGDSVPVFKYGGTTYSITLTKEMLQTLYEWITNTAITATSKIEAVDVTTPGATNMLIIMGLDHDLARAYDAIYAKKVRIECTVGDNLTSTITEAAQAVEDQGQGRLHKLWYNERAFAQTGSLQLTGFADTLLLPPNSIDVNVRYVDNIISFYHEDVQNNDHIHHQTRIHILSAATDDSGTATAATGITVTNANSTTVTTLNATLGAWLLSNNPFSLDGSSTTSQLFF